MQVNNCNGNPDYIDFPTWTSFNSAIMNSDGGGQFTGVGVGTTGIKAHIAQLASGDGRDTRHQCPVAPFDDPGEGQVTPTVSITGANVTTDSITVKLNGDSSSNGSLIIESDGPNVVNVVQNGGSYTSGQYTFNFHQDTLGGFPGDYTTIKATWNVSGQDYTATYNYHFRVLGNFEQTQYNTPSEATCSGGPQAITVWDNSCHGTDTTVRSGFEFRVTNPSGGTGSGYSINFGGVQVETQCSVGSGDLRGNQSIQGHLNGVAGPLNDSTVAVCRTNSDINQSGTQLYIRNEGVKSVTDSCGICCANGGAHLDNYTTNNSCSGITSLPTALTIRLF